MPNSKRREKNEAFRCLYGFGVLFILLSHCGGGGVSFLNNWVNFGAFHVAVFLFGSGYFFSDEDLLSPGKWFAKKLKKLLLPLFLWNVFYGIIIVILKHFGFFADVRTDAFYFLISPVSSDSLFLFDLAAWFVFPFFMVQVIWFLLLLLIKAVFKDGYKKMMIAEALLFIASGCAGILICNAGYRSDMLLPVFRILYFCPFYAAGYLLSLVDITKKEKVIPYLCIPALIISLLLNSYFGRSVYAIPSSCDYPFGLLATYLSAFCGIMLWLSISYMMTENGKMTTALCKPITFLADNGFYIMMHQFAGFFILNVFYLITSRMFNAFSDFDVSAFKTDIWYMYIPKGIEEYKFLYVLFGVGFSVLLGFVTKKIRMIGSAQTKQTDK